ncbi:Holliday junction resolvase RuvX [Candidatus Gracilibacteria bacterium]|nr:Holliday junction resolvase RuvX [Candidatus Gracilibacteria bacterium]
MPRQPPTERRVLALDLGERRIGVALSDVYGSLANPLTTIAATPRPQAIRAIGKIIADYQVVELVVGLPLTLRGEIGPQAQTVKSFAGEIASALNVPVHFFDERLSSAAADQMMRELGIKPDKRKQHIDQIAASIILQDYLDSTRGA